MRLFEPGYTILGEDSREFMADSGSLIRSDAHVVGRGRGRKRSSCLWGGLEMRASNGVDSLNIVLSTAFHSHLEVVGEEIYTEDPRTVIGCCFSQGTCTEARSTFRAYRQLRYTHVQRAYLQEMADDLENN